MLTQAAATELTTVTFSEYPVGTHVTSQYPGIVFGGDDPYITQDGSNPSTPVLTGTPQFNGAIRGSFVDLTGAARVVDGFTLDVGYIDDPGSVVVDVYGPDDSLLRTVPVDATGIVTVTVNQAGASEFLVHAAGYEAAGFAIDNVTFPKALSVFDTLVTPQFLDTIVGGQASFTLQAVGGIGYGSWSGVVLTGPNAGTDVAVTCVGVSCRATYFGSDDTGLDRVAFHEDENGNGLVDAGEPYTVVSVLWSTPVSAVVLGDSYTSGEGIAPYEPGTDNDTVNRNQCHRSTRAWSTLVEPASYGQPIATVAGEDTTGQTTFDFIACSGATTTDVLPNADPRVHQWQEPGTQLDQGKLNAGTDLVMLTIGGNDVGFSDVLIKCALKNCNDPQTTIHGQIVKEYVADRLAGLEPQLRTVLDDIKAQAPNATVLLLGYPHLFPATSAEQSCGWLTLWAGEMDWFNQVADQLNATMTQAAGYAGVNFLPVINAFAGHEACGAEGEWVNHAGLDGSLFDWANRAIATTGSFHPNLTGVTDGYAALINTFLQNAAESGNVDDAGLPYNPAPWNSGPMPTVVGPTAAAAATSDAGTDFSLGAATVTALPGDVRAACYPNDGLVRSGSPFLLTGDGFAPAAQVSITWDTSSNDATPAPVIGSATADQYGVVAATVQLPGGATAGDNALVTATGDSVSGTRQLLAMVDVNPSCPGTTPTVVSGSSLTLTNQFSLDGADGDLHVNGDFSCNSQVRADGNVVVSGNAYLTNTCTIGGSLTAGGAVTMNAHAQVGGDVTAAGEVSLQSTNRIGGYITAGGQVVVIDGKPIATLQANGTIGGTVTSGAGVPPVDLATWQSVAFDPATQEPGAAVVSWQDWMNATAQANDAPSWSQGRTAHPGCVMAPWGASVNGTDVSVTSPTVIDARSATSGCAGVALQQMTLHVSADVTIYADKFTSINGLKVLSADGAPHQVSLLVPGSQPSCSQNSAIDLSADTTFDPLLDVQLTTPGSVVLHDRSALSGTLDAGCLTSSGTVSISPAA